MLRIIVGQDPYPRDYKLLMIADYPVDKIVAFYQPVWNMKDVTFERIIRFVHINGVPAIDTKSYVNILRQKGLFLFNAFPLGSGLNPEQSNKTKIIDFIEIYCRDNGLCPDEVHLLFCGGEAKKLLSDTCSIKGFNWYFVPHPSPTNKFELNGVEVAKNFWDNQSAVRIDAYADYNTMKRIFQNK